MSRYDLQQLQRAAPDYLERLGLREAPFAASPDPRFFYADPARAQQLELIQHLSAYHDLFLLVSGPAGSGKTSFMHRLADTAPPGWRPVRIAADPLLGPVQLLDQLAAALGLAPGEDDARLYGRLAALQRAGEVPVLLVDDAHLLGTDSLEGLLRLAAAEGEAGRLVRVILFCDSGLEARLGTPPYKPLRQRISHGLELPRLDAEQTAEYLEHRLRVAGFDGELPFSPEQLRQIQRRSGGVPGRINARAHQFLNGGRGTRPPGGRARRAAPAVVAGVALLAAAAVAAGLLPGRPPDRVTLPLTPPSPFPGLDSAPQSAGPLRATPGGPVVASAAGPGVVPGTPEPGAAHPSAPEPAAAESAARAPAPPGEAKPAPAEGSLRDGAWVRAREPEHYTLQLVATRDPDRMHAFAERHGLTGQAAWFASPGEEAPVYHLLFGEYLNRTLAEVAIELLPADLGEDRPWVRRFGDIQAQLVRAKSGPAPAGAAAEQSAAEPASPPPALAPTLPSYTPIPSEPVAEAAWVWAQHPSQVTLQLLGSGDEAGIRRFIEANDLAGRAVCVRTLREGREWFVLVYGVYPDRARARAAIETLPPALRAARPWPRSFATLHAEMRSPSSAPP